MACGEAKRGRARPVPCKWRRARKRWDDRRVRQGWRWEDRSCSVLYCRRFPVKRALSSPLTHVSWCSSAPDATRSWHRRRRRRGADAARWRRALGIAGYEGSVAGHAGGVRSRTGSGGFTLITARGQRECPLLLLPPAALLVRRPPCLPVLLGRRCRVVSLVDAAAHDDHVRPRGAHHPVWRGVLLAEGVPPPPILTPGVMLTHASPPRPPPIAIKPNTRSGSATAMATAAGV